MQKKERFDHFVQVLESKKHDIQHSDFRFYNLAHFPLVFKRSLECSSNCSTCQKNITQLESMLEEIPHVFDSFKERKEFERQKNTIENHLKKRHNFHFPGYYAALGALVGFFSCLAAVIILNFIPQTQLTNKLNIFILGIGLLIGWFSGTAYDRKIFKKNMQL